MTELIKKAIDKIDSEAEKIGEAYAQLIASHIIDNYLKSEANAKIIVEGKKELLKCLGKIKSNAKRESHNGMAMVSDDVVFGWVVEYYGFTDESPKDSKIIDILDLI